jgi:DNA polymerase I
VTQAQPDRWPSLELHWVRTFEEACEFMAWLGERRPLLAVDTETGGFDWWRDPLRTVQFGDACAGWCIEHDRWGGLIDEALRRYEGPLAMHNRKFDTHFLEVNGYPVKRHLVHDTQTMAHLLDPTRLVGLKPRAGMLLGPYASYGQDEIKLAMMKGGWRFSDVPIELIWRYAAFDTVLTARIGEVQWPEVESQFRELYDLEMAVSIVLTDMERRGCMTDGAYLDRVDEEWRLEIAGIEHELREGWGVENPTSRQQLAQRMAADGVPFVEFTEKTGQPKMTEDVLASLDHPIARHASRLLQLGKFRKAYIGSMRDLRDADGVVHCNVNPLGARTGRMSASRPPLQQLPRRRDIRDAFVARDGNRLLLADFDQIEMRLLAHYSQDPAMLAAIARGDSMAAAGHEGWDLHSANARALWRVPDDQAVPKAQRQIMKSSGFAKVYGAGEEQFARTAGVDLMTAREFLGAYDRLFPGVNRFMRHVEATLRQRAGRSSRDAVGWVMSPYGRRHLVPLAKAYRGVNYLIQGTAADVMKDRLVAMAKAGLLPYMVLPIHDEVMLDVPAAEVEEVRACVAEVMPERDRFCVPLTVGIDVVGSWGEKYAA